MKKIISFVLSLLVFVSMTGCSKADQHCIIQLVSHSESQMMSYIIVANDKTIVVDGGMAEDESDLIDQIKQYSDDDTVDAWFITHYHQDHTGALAAYLNSGSDEISIDEIYYNFPTSEFVQAYDPDCYGEYDTIEKALEGFENKTVNYKGLHVSLDDEINVDVIRTFNDTITNNAGNNSSTVYKVETDGVKILFLGDLGQEGGQELLNEDLSEIQNMDFVQMAHHGQSGVNEDVYQAINPTYCLWPTPDWLWNNTTGEYKTLETREWISKLNVKKNYVANKDTIVIDLDSL